MDPCSLINEDMVKKCLKSDKGDSALLQSFQIKNFLKKGENYASVITSALVKYKVDEQDLEQSYVVKIKVQGDFTEITEAMRNELERESCFLGELAPILNQELQSIGLPVLNIPKVPYIFRDNEQEIYFFEDLRQRGFKMVDRRKGLDENHCLLLIQELARLHAASVLFGKRINIIEKYPLMKENFYGECIPEFRSTYAIFEGVISTSSIIAKQMGGYDDVVSYLKSLEPNIMDFLRKSLLTEKKFEVLIHGDCWTNNAMFRYNENGRPEEVMLIDFDLARVSSPAADLNYLYFTSLSDEFRRGSPDRFLQSYYDAFQKVLSTARSEVPFTFEEFEKEFKNLNPYGFAMGLVMISPVLREEGDGFQFDKINDDNMEEILKENQEDLLKLATDPVVLARFAEIFDGITAHGLK